MNQKEKKYKIFLSDGITRFFPTEKKDTKIERTCGIVTERCERASEFVCIKAASRLIWFASVRIISANMFLAAGNGWNSMPNAPHGVRARE